MALGLEDRLIAISHECDFPERILDRPRISRPGFDPTGLDSEQIDAAVRATMAERGSVYEIDGDALAALDPELILTQAVCEVCAVPTPGVRELVERRGLGARVESLDAHTLEGILDTIRQVGDAAGAHEAATSLIHALRARLEAVRRAVAGRPRPRVLAIEWLGPPFTPGHWVPEQIDVAGGLCIVGQAGRRSQQVEWTDLEGLDPDILLIMPCGYGVEASARAADRAADALRRVAPRAIERRHAYVVDGSSYFNRSGPRVVDGIEILAALFHPGTLAMNTDASAVWLPPVAAGRP